MRKTYISETSVGADVTGIALNMNKFTGFHLHIKTTGTLAGTFTLQETGDTTMEKTTNVAAQAALASWVTNPDVAFVNPSGSPDENAYHIGGFRAPWMRLVFTYSSGSGNLTVWFTAKDGDAREP